MNVQKINKTLSKAEDLLADNLISQYRYNRIREKLLVLAKKHTKYYYDEEYNKLCLMKADDVYVYNLEPNPFIPKGMKYIR